MSIIRSAVAYARTFIEKYFVRFQENSCVETNKDLDCVMFIPSAYTSTLDHCTHVTGFGLGNKVISS